MSSNENSVPASRWEIVILAAVVAIWLVARRSSEGTPPLDRELPDIPRAKSVDRDVIRDAKIGARVRPTPKPGHVIIRVTSSTGTPLPASAKSGTARHDVDGVAVIPANLGHCTISAPGYFDLDVEVGDSDLHVVLSMAHRVRGTAHDAVTKAVVAAATVTLASRSTGDRLDSSTTDATGSFELIAEPGEYSLECVADGYLPAHEALESFSPGILLDGMGADIEVSIPMYAVYVALCAVDNHTNLDDAILEDLLVSRMIAEPGVDVPLQYERRLRAQLDALRRSAGLKFPSASICAFTSQPLTLGDHVVFSVLGERIGELPVTFRPLNLVLSQPAPETLVLTRTWDVAELEIVTPIDLQIAEGTGGVPFGGIAISAGTTALRLPHGAYVIGPRDLHVFLDGAAWTRRIEVPEQSRVHFDDSSAIGTLRLRKTGEWGSGSLLLESGGATVGFDSRMEEEVMPVTPGSYALTFCQSAGDSMRTVWRREISIEAGQEVVMFVRPEPPK